LRTISYDDLTVTGLQYVRFPHDFRVILDPTRGLVGLRHLSCDHDYGLKYGMCMNGMFYVQYFCPHPLALAVHRRTMGQIDSSLRDSEHRVPLKGKDAVILQMELRRGAHLHFPDH